MAYIHVDKLLPQTTLQQFVDHYGFDTEIERRGKEERIKSPFPCDKCQGNTTIVAVDWSDQVFKGHCYHCDVRGSVTLLLYGMKYQRLPNSGNKLKGDEFKEIAQDIAAVAGSPSVPSSQARSTAANAAPTSSPVAKESASSGYNPPLSRNADERIRNLEHLDSQFVYDDDQLTLKAQSYLENRSYLHPEFMKRWNIGMLPSHSKSYIRGCMIYCLKNERSERLGWAGRHLNFEEKFRQWEKSDRTGNAPIKTKFPPGFHKGSFLYGAEISRLSQPGVREQIADTGLIVVEGFNDVLALDANGVVAVGLCGNQVAAGQSEKLVRWSNELAGGRITLFLDNNQEGRNGTIQAIEKLSDKSYVRSIWSPDGFEGRYKDMEPEHLSKDHLLELLKPVSRDGVVQEQLSQPVNSSSSQS